ncbi:MAG: protease, partial [Saprospiraceae bacterium]
MSNKSLLILLATSLLVFSCSKDKIADEALPQPESANQPATREQINEFVLSQLREHNVFKWEMADDHLLWSA